jgi:hypothetical protein
MRKLISTTVGAAALLAATPAFAGSGMLSHGFPWGVLGLIGLLGLIPRARGRG